MPATEPIPPSVIPHRTVLLLALIAASVALVAPASRAQSPQGVDLLVPVPESAASLAAGALDRPDTVAAMLTVVNADALSAAYVRIALPGGDSVLAQRSVGQTQLSSRQAWTGTIPSSPLASATFVSNGSMLQGSIRTLDAAYSIEPVGRDGLHVVRQMDSTQLPPEMEPMVPDLVEEPADVYLPQPDDGTVFDVLVVYTATARAEAGSDDAIRLRIALGVAETNAAYANSGILPRLRLVGAEPVDYVEEPTDGGMSADLLRLRIANDGVMDGVHARRDALGADMVQLIVGPQRGSCGQAYLMTGLSAGFATHAFGVTAYACISPNYSFGHELGHNMGSHHAPEDVGPGANALYPYSFGYKDPLRQFRTVMAYACSSGNCPRVLNFSNPLVSRSGAPTGTAAQHNNALSINNARLTIANWRAAIVEPPHQPTGLTLTASGRTVNFSWTPAANGPPATSYLIQAGGAPGLANLATINTGSSTPSFTVASVPPGTYYVRVIGVNLAGAGTPSENILLSMTPAGVCTSLPGAPALLPPAISGNTVAFSWNAPQSGAPPASYVVSAGSGPGQSNLAVVNAGGATSLAANAPNGLYFVRVAARNACGVGPVSNEVSVRLGPEMPGQPSGLVATVDNRVVTLLWTAPVAGGAPAAYRIEAGSEPGLSNLAAVSNGSPATTFVVGAPPGRYYVRVRGLNAAGLGLPSNEIVVVVP